MNDRELLESAAKAAGYRIHGWINDKFYVINGPNPAENYDPFPWNGIEDDGDALRLAVKLKLDVFTGQGMRGDITTVCAPPEHDIESCGERHGDDPLAATRLAIVRAAAAIWEED